jgi:small multidrug resistance pump
VEGVCCPAQRLAQRAPPRHHALRGAFLRIGEDHGTAATERTVPYLYLAIAILAEVIGTSMLKLADGFTRIVPGMISVAAYFVALFFLSLTLKTIPTGIVYAIWSGIGIVLIATVAWLWQGQKLDLPAMAGMVLIILGVIVMNLFSKASVG